MISDEQVTEVLRLTGEFFRQSIRRRESDLAVGEGALLGILRMRGETTGGRAVRNSARRLGADRQSFETYRSEGLYRPQKVGGGSAKSIGVDYAERTKRERKAREQDPQQSASYPRTPRERGNGKYPAPFAEDHRTEQ